MTTEMTLAPGEAREVIFALGQADSLEEVHRLIGEYTQAHRVHAALTQVEEKWDGYLNALHVTTPDPGIDLMLNRWLVYQVLACRVLGPFRLLPIRRSVWLSRPTAGCEPGIRENGGQYTHAATWVALATALQGRGDLAMDLCESHQPGLPCHDG